MKLVKLKYEKLLEDIGSTIERARDNAIRIINTELVKANWEIGRHIVEYEQHGEERAEYGSALLTTLSKDLRNAMEKDLADAMFWICADFMLLIRNGRQCLPN